MIANFTWIYIYDFMKRYHREYYLSSDLVEKLDSISRNSILEGLQILERLDVLNSERIGRERRFFKTQKFFEVEDIFTDIFNLSTRK